MVHLISKAKFGQKRWKNDPFLCQESKGLFLTFSTVCGECRRGLSSGGGCRTLYKLHGHPENPQYVNSTLIGSRQTRGGRLTNRRHELSLFVGLSFPGSAGCGSGLLHLHGASAGEWCGQEGKAWPRSWLQNPRDSPYDPQLLGESSLLLDLLFCWSQFWGCLVTRR